MHLKFAHKSTPLIIILNTIIKIFSEDSIVVKCMQFTLWCKQLGPRLPQSCTSCGGVVTRPSAISLQSAAPCVCTCGCNLVLFFCWDQTLCDNEETMTVIGSWLVFQCIIFSSLCCSKSTCVVLYSIETSIKIQKNKTTYKPSF